MAHLPTLNTENLVISATKRWDLFRFTCGDTVYEEWKFSFIECIGQKKKSYQKDSNNIKRVGMVPNSKEYFFSISMTT